VNCGGTSLDEKSVALAVSADSTIAAQAIAGAPVLCKSASNSIDICASKSVSNS
jgi:hypothetical protein